MATQTYQMHTHEAMVHKHEHIHVVHHARGGPGGEIEHLTAVHDHSHNHAALEHAHEPHENREREHTHEDHIHDHSHPEQS